MWDVVTFVYYVGCCDLLCITWDVVTCCVLRGMLSYTVNVGLLTDITNEDSWLLLTFNSEVLGLDLKTSASLIS